MKTDLLVIGSGIAGMTVALKASKFCSVILVTKDVLRESNTTYAQGGMAAVFGKDDSVSLHVQDTLRAGDGLSSEEAATVLAKESPKRVLELKKMGVPFTTKKGKLALSREAVHTRSRIAHVKDTTGQAIVETMASKVEAKKNISILDNTFAVDLLVTGGRCVGCSVLQRGEPFAIFSKAVVLATGGVGALYSTTTNPEIATGDGLAMAYRAGAVLEDMEFLQFHPTMLHNSKPPFLISETLRGEGGILKNRFGKSYMSKYHRDGEMAPRDVVSHFSVKEMTKTKAKHVFLDVTHLDSKYLRKRFPSIYKECLRYGIDLTQDMIPVSPAAHYLCGGVQTDLFGRTSLKGLYAVGECACTQLHGADRLASNSMTEGAVIGSRLVGILKKEMPKRFKVVKKRFPKVGSGDLRLVLQRKLLQQTMWNDVGVDKSKKGLLSAQARVKRIEKRVKKINGRSKEKLELQNMILVSLLIIKAALRRKESRGTHFMKDYPDRFDNIWKTHLTMEK